jgi:hypothetical protein
MSSQEEQSMTLERTTRWALVIAVAVCGCDGNVDATDGAIAMRDSSIVRRRDGGARDARIVARDARLDEDAGPTRCGEGEISLACICGAELREDGHCCSGVWQPSACPRPDYIVWTDSLQTGTRPWGFDGLEVEHPIDNAVDPDDANGANLSRVMDPAGGSGFALRHFGLFDDGGARSQAGIWSFENEAFAAQARSEEGVWVAMEWYFPEVMEAEGAWLNLWDWHSLDDDGDNRWHTSPGLMLDEDGSMRVRWDWGGDASEINPQSERSSIPLPVGEWFDIEMYYRWTDEETTLSLWIDGELALEQSGVQTRRGSHAIVETYIKFYGQADSTWTPTPSVRYTRNVRVASERIWR